MKLSGKWRDPKIIILSQVIQTQKDKYSIFSLVKFGSLDLYVQTGVTREFRKLVRHCGRNRNQDEGKGKGSNKIGKDE